jgi:hypothetical protein
MSMQQKAKDAVQLIKKDRKAQVFVVLIICGVLFLTMHEPKQRRRGPGFAVREQSADTLGAATANEVYNDLQQVVVRRLDEQKESMNQIRESLDDTNKRIEENEIRTAEIFETLIKRVESQRQEIPAYGNGAPVDGVPLGDAPVFPEEEVLGGDSLESFGEIADEGVVAPPQFNEADSRSAYIAPTDHVRVKLLAGVNAPTDGTPYPVLLQLVGDVQSPDGASLPLGDARILAAAQGSLVDSRALFRLTTLTMRLPNGEVMNLDIDGYMVGEDGILGLPGVPIDPLGKALGASALSGFVQGAGNAISNSQVTTITGDGGISQAVTGDGLEFAAGQGLAQPANMWANIIRQRVEEAVPVIQVYSGREATAVFTRGTVVPKLYDMLNASEEDVFSGLD